MEKIAERSNVLTESDGKNFIHSVLNAVTKGYADNTIVEDVLELVKANEISRGILQSAPNALRSYAKSISESLAYIADEVEGFEIQDPRDMIVNRKLNEQPEEVDDDNIIDKGMRGEDDEKEDEDDEGEKLSSRIASKSGIKIIEDWEKSGYNEKENKIAGIIQINFGQDMSIYKHGKKVLVKESGTKYIRDKIFAYLCNEYPKLKANLSSKIFTSGIEFTNLKEGKAKLSFEIRNAY